MTIDATIPRLKSARPLLQRSSLYYPDSDGEPTAENDPHYYCITDTRFALQQYFKEDADIYVGADLLVYYVEGDPTKSVAPDVLVAFGVPQGHRRSFCVWEEGKAPDVVFEFASEATWRDDLGWKRGLYLGLGIEEYFLLDPTGLYLDPPLQGFHLTGMKAEPYPTLSLEDKGVVGLQSDLLGLELWAKATDEPDMPHVLRFFDPVQQTWLLTPNELAAEQQAAAAEIARLQAELIRLRQNQ